MRTTLPLGLRNRLAEMILDAFDHEEPRRTLEALAAFCRSEELGAGAAARLLDLGWFEAASPGHVRLLGAHRAHRDALGRRAIAALGALGPAPSDLLTRAARLADAGLYFEVHELLEPAWMRAEGDERLALQGLIQVAVAFHHAEHDNRAGAVSLLTEGLAKLAVAGAALPLDAAGWTRRLHEVLAAWRAGASAPAAAGWPAPTEAAWPSF
jgi:DUF309 family protein family protein